MPRRTGDSMRHISRSRSLPRVLWVAAAVLAADFALAGDAYSVRNGTVAGGGGVTTSGPYRLVWTIGEPAMGTTSQGQFRLTSGYPATIGDALQGGPGGGSIFADGFED